MDGTLAVLMYHAIMDDGKGCLGADRHYSVSSIRFSQQLKALRNSGLHATSVVRLLAGAVPSKAVAVTFDDGHISNLKAAEDLANNAFSADFFVNPSSVGSANHLGWAHLREMVAAGMSIQSHGFHHRYLDELSPLEVMSELVDSKREIEDRLGSEVSVFAPPGGRTSAGLAESAARAGYGAVCTSRVGLWDPKDSPWAIPRLAVLNSTSDARFVRWIERDRLQMAVQRARYLALSSAKRVLGNEGYERLRLGLLPRRRL